MSSPATYVAEKLMPCCHKRLMEATADNEPDKWFSVCPEPYSGAGVFAGTVADLSPGMEAFALTRVLNALKAAPCHQVKIVVVKEDTSLGMIQFTEKHQAWREVR